MKELAEAIADEIFRRLEPELHRAMVEKIISVASDKWRTQFVGDVEISGMIDQSIRKSLADKYKPALEYIADKKAQEKVLKPASAHLDTWSNIDFNYESKDFFYDSGDIGVCKYIFPIGMV